MKATIQKRAFSLLLVLTLILGLLPVSALAVEDGSDTGTPVVCAELEGCTGDEHAEDCPLYVAPEEELEGDSNSYYELEDVYGIGDDTVEEQLAALIAALPDPSEIDPSDEEQVEAIHNQLAEIYAFAEANGLGNRDDGLRDAAAKATVNTVIAAMRPAETLEDPSTKGDMSGNCEATDSESSVTWKLEQNNEDTSNPTYTLTISGNGAMADYSSGSGMPWNSQKESITNVIIEDGVTHIGDRSFMGCSALISLTISDSVTSYGTNPFNNCTSLESLSIGKNVESIGQIGISADAAMKTLTVAAGNTAYASINNWLYELEADGTAILWQVPAGCVKDETSLTVPSTITWNGQTYSVTGIGKADSDSYTLAGAKSMNSLSFESNIKEIGANAFNGTALTSIDLSDVDRLGDNAFINCASLTSVTLGNLEAIPNGAFRNCSALVSIELPETVQTIGRYAFCGTGLTALNIPTSVATIGDFAFQSCTSLISVSGGAGLTTLGSAVFLSSPVETVNIVGTASLTIPANTFAQQASPERIKSFTLMNGMFASSFEFKSKNTLETVTLGGGVNTIPASLFKSQTALKTLTILEGITTIGDYAFQGCTFLTELTVPDSVTTIGKYAFGDNTSLKVVRIGSGLTSLGEQAFNACTALEVLDLSEVKSEDFLPSSNVMINRTNGKLAVVYVASSTVATAWGNKGTTSTTLVAVTNGGTFAEDTEFTSGTLATPVRDGCKFEGWYSDSSFAENNKVTDQRTLTANSTYYAKWTPSSYSVAHSLSFDALTYGSTPVSKTLTVTAPGVESPSVTSVTNSESFTASASDMTITVTPKDNLSVGTYNETIVVTTGDGATHNVAVSLTVTKAGSTVDPGEDKDNITATYGDTITLIAKTQRATETGIALMTALDKVDFYCGQTYLGSAEVTYDANGVGTATLSYKTAKGGIPVGSKQTITASYGGSVNLNGSFTNSISVTLSPKVLTAPVLTDYTATTTSITVTAPAIPTGASKVQYSIDGGSTWQDSNEFSGLTSGTSYSVTAKFVADDSGNYADSANSTALSTKTNSTGGSGGGGGGGTTTYTVTVDSTKNGTVSVSPKSASKGTTVTITVKPDSGYELDDLTATDKNGGTVKLTRKSDTQYTFTMPASKVTVEASFAEIGEQPKVAFVDVSTNAYYYDAVAWAVENGVTSGTSATTFSPDAACTRAQAVTFLWRAAGSPTPKSSVNSFTDVSTSAYYYDAVLWAVEQGITVGTSATTFSPDATCTRGQIVTFLFRAVGTTTSGTNPFVDVADRAYYADAVKWAVAESVTAGTSASTFSPDASCTRAQIVTFLYRAYA